MKRRRIKVATPNDAAGETPSRGEKIKEMVLLSLFNVALPSLDVYSDLGLIVKFYIGSRHHPYCDETYSVHQSVNTTYQDHLVSRFCRFNCYYHDNDPKSPATYAHQISCYDGKGNPSTSNNVTYTPHYSWGTMMLVPFLLNYLICWYAWLTTDKRKSVSWIAALLSFYPQYVACKIIWQIWIDPRKGLQKKGQLERNLTQHETFTEAVLSTLIMTYLLTRAFALAEGSEIIFNILDLEGNIDGSFLFFVAFSTSIITSSLGLAKNLKVGPCRILPEAEGLLSPRFLLLFLACGLTLVSKALALALTFVELEKIIQGGATYRDPAKIGILQGTALFMTTIFLPGLLVGLFSCWHRGILKTFLTHPSILLLPVFTNFTFVSNSKVCCGGRGGKKEETYLVFSQSSLLSMLPSAL